MKKVMNHTLNAIVHLTCFLIMGALVPTILALFTYVVSDSSIRDVFGNLPYAIFTCLGTLIAACYVASKEEGTW